MLSLDLIIGSGGVLSHAPNRRSAALMLLDAYEPEGVTRLAVDSVFMMPHLGVLSTVLPDAAAEIFVRDCLVDLGTAIAPSGDAEAGDPLLDAEFKGEKLTLHAGQLLRRELAVGEKAAVRLRPRRRWIDIGAGPGKEFETEVCGGHAGILFDGRGRPLRLAVSEPNRLRDIREWYRTLALDWGGEH